MSRPKGSKNKSKDNNQTVSQPQNFNQVFQSNQSDVDPIKYAEDFAIKYINQYSKFVQNYANVLGTGYYNPIYANNAMKQFTTPSNKPTENELIQWLLDPRHFEQQLRGCSDWLTYACEFYTRTIYYAGNILNFDYELVPVNPPDVNSDKSFIDLYLRQKKLNNDWLRCFRLKEQCSNILLDIVKFGGRCYYLRHSENSDYLQSMPDDYVYINGRTDLLGFTYSMNMSFFYQFPKSIRGFAPEFADWYKNFITQDGTFNLGMNPYMKMPVDKSVVFKFDDTRPELIPPFAGVFKNALEIEDYQDLLKLKAQLQTFQLLYLEIPKDANGKPTITAQEAINYVAVAQAQVPTGTGIVSTPMTLNQVKFDNSQNFNNIIGLGATNYYQSSGLTPAIFGDATKSAIGITNSIQTDYLMFEGMYDQFERFINYQLSKIQGKFNFMIRFLRHSNFTTNDDIKNSSTLLDHGGQVGRVLSAMGEEPWQQENLLIDNKLSNINNLLIVPQTAFTQSSKGSNKSGAPTAEDKNQQISDSNDQTRSDGGNVDKQFSKHCCLNCGIELSDDNQFKDFCNVDCMKEYLEQNGEIEEGE